MRAQAFSQNIMHTRSLQFSTSGATGAFGLATGGVWSVEIAWRTEALGVICMADGFARAGGPQRLGADR